MQTILKIYVILKIEIYISLFLFSFVCYRIAKMKVIEEPPAFEIILNKFETLLKDHIKFKEESDKRYEALLNDHIKLKESIGKPEIEVIIKDGYFNMPNYIKKYAPHIKLDSGNNVDKNEVLFIACRKGHIDVIEYLIAKGVDIHINTTNKRSIQLNASKAYEGTALSCASKLNIAKYLIEVHKVDIHANKDNALFCASYFGRLDVVKYLIASGADTNANKAVQYAALRDHMDIVKILVEAGADIHANNNEALVRAYGEGRAETFKFLVEKCNCDIRNQRDMPTEGRNEEITEFLRDLRSSV